MASTPALFLADAEEITGDPIVLAGAEGRHAATVRRTEVGELVDLADGAGTRVRCEVVEVGRDRLVCRVRDRTVEAPAVPPITVVQALPKGDRGGLAVELMTEVGVDEVLPWQARHSIARWHGERGAKAAAKWRSTARAAAKQARRARLPVVADVVDTAAVAARLREAALGLVLDGSAGVGLGQVARPSAGEVVVVVGPEGGFAEEELAAMTRAGALRVALGATVLRTSTAGAVAVAVLRTRGAET